MKRQFHQDGFNYDTALRMYVFFELKIIMKRHFQYLVYKFPLAVWLRNQSEWIRFL